LAVTAFFVVAGFLTATVFLDVVVAFLAAAFLAGTFFAADVDFFAVVVLGLDAVPPDAFLTGFEVALDAPALASGIEGMSETFLMDTAWYIRLGLVVDDFFETVLTAGLVFYTHKLQKGHNFVVNI
jgi:hypothetical protein